MDILLTYDYGKEKIKKMVEIGYNIILKEEKDLFYSDEFENVEVIICYNPFKTLDVSKFNNLKWIQLSSIGIDQLPIEKIINREIIVSNNQGGYSKPMGEWVVLSILEILKNKKEIFVNQQNKKWKMDTGILELVNKKILFLGTGTIAKESAKRLKGFECLIDGINTSGREQEYFKNVYKSSEISKVLADYDIVISTLPKIKETFHYINKELMDLMKNDSILINVSRGEIIDEAELINQLHNGKFLGVSLDVFEIEPLSELSDLWNFDRVYISAHNSWISEMKNERRFDVIYKNLKRYKNNNILLNEVNYIRGY